MTAVTFDTTHVSAPEPVDDPEPGDRTRRMHIADDATVLSDEWVPLVTCPLDQRPAYIHVISRLAHGFYHGRKWSDAGKPCIRVTDDGLDEIIRLSRGGA